MWNSNWSHVIIGKNVSISQQVTIGGNYGKIRNYKRDEGDIMDLSMPLIEDNCIFSPGSKVLGPIVIGQNSLIGANIVLTKDVPKNSKVIGRSPIIKTI